MNRIKKMSEWIKRSLVNIEHILCILGNILLDYDVLYVVENVDWSIKQDGALLKECLKNDIKIRIGINAFGARKRVIHFGSANTLIRNSGVRQPHESNRIILTWFHVEDGDHKLKFLSQACKIVDIVHTSCSITQSILIEHGCPSEKIRLVPIPIDLRIFNSSLSEESLLAIKKKLEIPDNKFVLGSFQKDGIGWGLGSEPKLIKGPDLFWKGLQLSEIKSEVHILLTGPARGYLKKHLNEIGVSYSHVFVKDFKEIPKFYEVLDGYLITSRAEGGPKAMLECFAMGVPLITTKVGMVVDFCSHKKNSLIISHKKPEAIAKALNEGVRSVDLLKKIKRNGLEEVEKFSYHKLGKSYLLIYQSLIKGKGF